VDDIRVAVSGLKKVFRGRRGELTALDNVSVEVRAGEIMVVLGPSGCGKTTLLRCIAGLERPDAGEISVHRRTVFSSITGAWVPPERRRLSMVFQSYALWPHMTVFDNVAYPLQNVSTPRGELVQRTSAVLELVGLESYATAYPGQLSGGQQQRVALARAIVTNDGVILFDEPLSNLDVKVRERLRFELLALHEQIGFTAVYVTHDQVEAAAMADRIAVMNVGRIAQLGPPSEVYNRPSSRYVADFVGSANEIAGTVSAQDGSYWRVTTAIGDLLARTDALLAAGQDVTLLFRPERCRLLSEASAPGPNQVACRVQRSIFLGSQTEHLVKAANFQFVLRTLDLDTLGADSRVTVLVDPDHTWAFPVP
jgi:iron(III) transport system ATP-binding protein